MHLSAAFARVRCGDPTGQEYNCDARGLFATPCFRAARAADNRGGVRKAQREATATELRRSRQDAEPGFRRRDQGLAIAGPCGSFSYVELHWTTRLDGASSRLRW
jgi:hypothetical protein